LFGEAVWICKGKVPVKNPVSEVRQTKQTGTSLHVKEINNISRRQTRIPPNDFAQNSVKSIEFANTKDG
jgi:hypothetical protein